MRATLLALVATSLCTGCTSTQLGRYTVNQSMSVADMRYRQVLNALAVVANNNGNLPSLALTKSGIANLTNTVSVDTATLWDAAVKGFSKETLVAFGQHNPDLQWTQSPIVSAPQLEALGYACIWAVRQAQGMEVPPPGSYPSELLRELRLADFNGCGFDLRLIPDNSEAQIPDRGHELMIVKKDKDDFHFRIFDKDGTQAADVGDGNLTKNQIESLTLELQTLWSQSELSPTDKCHVIGVVSKLVGYEAKCSKEDSPSQFHFGVLDQLEKLPLGWLHVNRSHFAPPDACYKATCGNTTVWVTSDGVHGLSEFTLIMLDIETTNPSSVAATKHKVPVELTMSPDKDLNFNVQSKDFRKGDKITEKWDACQRECNGPIELTRGDFKKTIPIPTVKRKPGPAKTVRVYSADPKRWLSLNPSMEFDLTETAINPSVKSSTEFDLTEPVIDSLSPTVQPVTPNFPPGSY